MKEILIWVIISVILFFGFLLTFILGFIKKKRKYFFYAIGIFALFGCTSIMTAYKFVSKSYNKVTHALKPRSGDEIYHALFGKPSKNCVKVLNYQDQVIPKIDYAIWLHFESCPDELKRVLSLHTFKSEVVSTKDWNLTGPSANENWFKPESLGDSVIVFTYNKDDYGNGQFIYSSLDSTRVYCQDILD